MVVGCIGVDFLQWESEGVVRVVDREVAGVVLRAGTEFQLRWPAEVHTVGWSYSDAEVWVCEAHDMMVHLLGRDSAGLDLQRTEDPGKRCVGHAVVPSDQLFCSLLLDWLLGWSKVEGDSRTILFSSPHDGEREGEESLRFYSQPLLLCVPPVTHRVALCEL